jgi:hypothetical protein
MAGSDLAPEQQSFQDLWNKRPVSEVFLARRRQQKSQSAKTAGADSQSFCASRFWTTGDYDERFI